MFKPQPNQKEQLPLWQQYFNQDFKELCDELDSFKKKPEVDVKTCLRLFKIVPSFKNSFFYQNVNLAMKEQEELVTKKHETCIKLAQQLQKCRAILPGKSVLNAVVSLLENYGHKVFIEKLLKIHYQNDISNENIGQLNVPIAEFIVTHSFFRGPLTNTFAAHETYKNNAEISVILASLECSVVSYFLEQAGFTDWGLEPTSAFAGMELLQKVFLKQKITDNDEKTTNAIKIAEQIHEQIFGEKGSWAIAQQCVKAAMKLSCNEEDATNLVGIFIKKAGLENYGYADWISNGLESVKMGLFIFKTALESKKSLQIIDENQQLIKDAAVANQMLARLGNDDELPGKILGFTQELQKLLVINGIINDDIKAAKPYAGEIFNLFKESAGFDNYTLEDFFSEDKISLTVGADILTAVFAGKEIKTTSNVPMNLMIKTAKVICNYTMSTWNLAPLYDDTTWKLLTKEESVKKPQDLQLQRIQEQNSLAKKNMSQEKEPSSQTLEAPKKIH